ncbi:PaaI family thioesterase [Cryptosporangium aurantiacum]|uniref:Uncharacterized domain 1-containing protein n=1 Tax=Cryptosporangium aurantiacum TaxID=134849 RepID=A0A1M7QY98_9ACTN|nr:PaaI family thioesterase [Cryptosporangium aurantiacum]SHN36758.1 uncharacterized domain 1-containing protein [Cryptosporangium aurantiacum]
MSDEHLVSERGITAGERYADGDEWENRRTAGPNLWKTLGYRRAGWAPGRSVVEWEATVDYCFPAAGGPIVQGGLVTALLDAAMGGACWTVLDRDQAFLTADLRVEFLRSAHPVLLRATGEVIRRTRRVVFCAAELHDADGVLLATSRCTQVLLPAGGRAGRYGPPEADGGPPRDARG